jgi:hypothetical protein
LLCFRGAWVGCYHWGWRPTTKAIVNDKSHRPGGGWLAGLCCTIKNSSTLASRLVRYAGRNPVRVREARLLRSVLGTGIAAVCDIDRGGRPVVRRMHAPKAVRQTLRAYTCSRRSERCVRRTERPVSRRAASALCGCSTRHVAIRFVENVRYRRRSVAGFIVRRKRRRMTHLSVPHLAVCRRVLLRAVHRLHAEAWQVVRGGALATARRPIGRGRSSIRGCMRCIRRPVDSLFAWSRCHTTNERHPLSSCAAVRAVAIRRPVAALVRSR